MKICIVGSSGHYVYALRGIKEDPHAQIVGISPGCEGENIERLHSQVNEMGFTPVVYSNPIRMFEDLKPDIAVINTFFYKNSELAIEAMKRGIHVYMEKPVALSIEKLEELKSVWRQTKVKLSSMLGLRYTPHFWTAYKLINENKIGRIRLIHAQKSYKLGTRPDFYKHRRTYGGTIPWVGIHAIDWIYWLSGKKFKSVFAGHSKLYNNDHGELESTAFCSFVMEDEIFATVNIDYLRPATAPTHDDDRIRIVGTRGIFEVLNGKVFLLNDTTKEISEVSLEKPPIVFLDFLNEVRGTDKCLVSSEDSFYVTFASLLARQSADEDKVIEF
ncbi:putative dehydrogenase [Caldicellulosiruptor bescii]|uniref:Oxidoreductase domain protein n=2 Tax=Caldicellulosiruptor bescii TaxID=31899 RepID=B9MLG5_CALBD|nr:Gfo/Idh/MocA family oxidoreductase [Caldicellulosiruptor bescii]ACM61155.1 oxidoreductase domain protein [Caldicellulosiruptor bescii DSM 6725]PBC89032.1 putative dehydrogenase [Caldicellulosiruptor bescii]PBC91486.1 putative dehydrogenase [Caldicellulosiruptor bescii]PBD03102.1 putative dehydrogenase [Caldicellulosiruptor bescii]PBD07284.1 putative dehydrogenase [Caldicellulosiruptor bescii]